jgi:hypothetical protein
MTAAHQRIGHARWGGFAAALIGVLALAALLGAPAPAAPAAAAAAAAETAPAASGPAAAAEAHQAQRAVQQAELVGSDVRIDDFFGYQVGIDGDTAVVGAPTHKVGSRVGQGAAYVFVRSGGVWTQQAVLTAAGGRKHDYFGCAVAVDGDTILAGAWNRAGGKGAAYVFVRSGGVWTQQAMLKPTRLPGDTSRIGFFGCTADLDGDRAVIGASNTYLMGYSGSGAAYVFSRIGGTWTQMGNALGAKAKMHVFGEAVAISGGFVLVGDRFADVAGSSRGAVYVFGEYGRSWFQVARLSVAGEQFGMAVALTGDTAVVGAPYHKVGGAMKGAAYVFVRGDESGEKWTLQAKLTAAGGNRNDLFGCAVAIEGDTALVGARRRKVGGNATQGAAYVFRRAAGAWTQNGEPITATGGHAHQRFGYSVALSGPDALVSAPFHNSRKVRGRDVVYVFTL